MDNTTNSCVGIITGRFQLFLLLTLLVSWRCGYGLDVCTVTHPRRRFIRQDVRRQIIQRPKNFHPSTQNAVQHRPSSILFGGSSSSSSIRRPSSPESNNNTGHQDLEVVESSSKENDLPSFNSNGNSNTTTIMMMQEDGSQLPSLTDLEMVEFPKLANTSRIGSQQGTTKTTSRNLMKAAGDNVIKNSNNTKTNSNITRLSSNRNNNMNSVMGTTTRYNFPFFQMSTNINSNNERNVVGNIGSTSNRNVTVRYNQPKKESVGGGDDVADKGMNITSLLVDKNPNDTITVSDLEKILSSISITNIENSGRAKVGGGGAGVSVIPNTAASRNVMTSSTSTSPNVKTSTKSTQQVAFPQPSQLSHDNVQRGSTVAGGILGLILGITILPNLWLVGVLIGGAYGYDVGKKDSMDGEQGGVGNKNMIGRFLIFTGEKLARGVLQVYDYWKAMWFLYKTGQLSYEYYKRYESLDRRFEIQNKVDAWNARFVEGKKRFDAWEQEHEVGRTVLAGLRTIWLVDEQARRRANEKKSRYRVIQSLYDGKYWISRRLVKARVWFRNQFRPGSGTIYSFIEGVRWDLTNNQDSVRTRIGAALAAVVAVNIGGALFSISPTFSNFLAIMVAMVWPTWVTDVASLLKDIGEEFQEKGRRGADSAVVRPVGNNRPSRRDGGKSSLASSFDARNLFGGGYDKNRYHFYVQLDGKTKRFYRTGQSSSLKNRGKTSPPSWLDTFLRRSSSDSKNKSQTRAVSPSFWGGFFVDVTNENNAKRR